MNGFITIRGIRKMYDSVNARFNLDTNSGRGVDSGSGRIGRGENLSGNVWPRFKDSIYHVFTSGKLTHRRSVVGTNEILTHVRGQQRGKWIINLAFDPY
jgi:hypothetical protein